MRGFTLLEMLITVAIISLLAGILVPTVGFVIETTRGASCATNLRGLVTGLTAYAVQNNGMAMPLADQTVSPHVYWWGTNEAGQIDHTKGFLYPYLGKAGLETVFDCPSQPWGSYDPQGAAASPTSTYGYNGYYLNPPSTPGWMFQISHRPARQLLDVDNRDRVIAFADTLIGPIGNGTRPRNNALLDPPNLYSRSDGSWTANYFPTTCFRHSGAANAAFVSGAVRAVKPEDGGMTHPEFHIGSITADNDPYYVPDWRKW